MLAMGKYTREREKAWMDIILLATTLFSLSLSVLGRKSNKSAAERERESLLACVCVCVGEGLHEQMSSVCQKLH